MIEEAMPSLEHTDPALDLRDLQFAYRDARPAVDGLSLSVPSGSFFGLLGPNGSGKTTTMRLCAGALRPSRGEVSVQGRPLAAWGRDELARTIAVVPQHFELAFPFTVLEVVLMGRTPHREQAFFDSPEDLAIARRAMEATDVLPLAKRRLYELSGGEAKRVIVAKALAQEPRILLLDEPAAFLDIRHQVALYQLIDRIRREHGVTVISAMHDLNLAAAYCDGLALLKAGRLVKSGSVAEVMTYRLLKETFDVEIYVGLNEITGHRLFSPMVNQAPAPKAAP